jgi:hypothetical protein
MRVAAVAEVASMNDQTEPNVAADALVAKPIRFRIAQTDEVGSDPAQDCGVGAATGAAICRLIGISWAAWARSRS